MATVTSPIRVPTLNNVTQGAVRFGQGAIAGGIVSLIQGWTGSGFLGNILAASVAAATMRGASGETVAIVAGYNAFNAPGGLFGNGPMADASAQPPTM